MRDRREWRMRVRDRREWIMRARDGGVENESKR